VEGDIVGTREGHCVGFLVLGSGLGEEVGTVVGGSLLVGTTVGDMLGMVVGRLLIIGAVVGVEVLTIVKVATVSTAVGADVGVRDGYNEGFSVVGAVVGDELGTVVGGLLLVGTAVEETVGIGDG
jgi:hypothetical protein